MMPRRETLTVANILLKANADKVSQASKSSRNDVLPTEYSCVEKSPEKLEPKEPKRRATKDPHSFMTDLGSESHTDEQSIRSSEVPHVHDRLISNDTLNTPGIQSVIVLDIPLTSFNGSIIQLGERAIPGHFRLIDCNAFLDFHLLRVVQYAEFFPKELSYAAISYPWRDLQLSEDTHPSFECFGVHGAEEADPITVGVLRTACIAARKFGASLLWLDRLCMIQSSKPDKSWQITRMSTVYAHANPCLVLPGGLVRLAHLNEPTTWIDRAWTLQEAAANPIREAVKCVYAFPHATFADFARNLPNFSNYPASFRSNLTESDYRIFMQHIIEPGHSAACDLLDFILHIHWMSETFDFADPVFSKDYCNLPVRMISAPAASLLRQALNVDRSVNRQLLWMSAFVRTSSRPVDMIFSFMGLVGVQLQVTDFGVNDRKGATIKLIQTLLRRGEPAVWLFIAPELPPSPELSILPVFPETSVSGRAMVRTSKGLKLAFEEIGLKEPWRAHGAPKGVMSDDGYFTFSAKGAPALGVEHAWAIMIGRKKEHNRDPATGRISVWDHDKPFPVIVELVLMFVEKHGCDAEGKELYHRIGMENLVDEKKTARWSWVEREFSVGGPGKGDRVRFSVEEAGPLPIDMPF